MKLFIALLTAASLSHASHLLGPIEHLQGQHIGDAEPLNWDIEYYDEWGRTVCDETGGHFYHDRCCGGFLDHDPTWIYPEEVWGTYPMYYIGTTMRYRITLTNNGKRSYRNLRVVAIQEYLSPDHLWGERMGHDAARDWFIQELRGGESVVLEGAFSIPADAQPGLDQTHLQVQHWDQGRGLPGPGSVIIDDVRAAIWCPPDLHVQALLLASGQARLVRATVDSTKGEDVVLAVRPTDSGLANVEIYSSSGSRVRTLDPVAVAANQLYEIHWDGRNDYGQIVASGVYLAKVNAPGIDQVLKVVVVR